MPASKGRRERKYVEMDERDDAARPQEAETNWFKVLTFGYAPACGSGGICVRIRARGGRRCGMPDARLAHQLSRVTHARGFVRRHLNPLLETGFLRPILFEDLPPLAAHDHADSVRQVPRVRAPSVSMIRSSNRRRNADQNTTFL